MHVPNNMWDTISPQKLQKLVSATRSTLSTYDSQQLFDPVRVLLVMILFGTPCAVPRRRTHSFTKTPSMTLTPMPACDGQVHFIQIGRNFSSKTVSSNDTFIPKRFHPKTLFPNIPSKSDHSFPCTSLTWTLTRTAQKFALFSLSVSGVFSWNCGHGSRPWTTQIARLGYFVKPQCNVDVTQHAKVNKVNFPVG